MSLGLNEAQREAVTHGDGPLLVLAGAGSGKTRVITHRIAHLIRRGVSPKTIIALSFTNKAAREMAERVRELVGKTRAEGLTVSTFHSLGLNILRQEGKREGYTSRFTLTGEGERSAAIRQLVREMALPFDPSAVAERISFWKNRGWLPGQARREAPPEAGPLVDLYGAYQEILQAQQGVDFDDLLLAPLHIFRNHPDALFAWQNRYAYLLVDEYQDTNRVQFQLLEQLAGERRNLCVVGDDDQSIYGWRGAEVDLILRFPKQFAGAKTVILDENYRSTQTILDASHAVVKGLPDRYAKRLRTDNGRGAPVGLIEAADEVQEAEEIAAAILSEHFRTRQPWTHFAVLYRTNGQARPFEQVFRSHDIPHVVVGGNRFFDRKEVRDVMSYLRVIRNPRDDASLLRIANLPRRGLGHQTLLKLRDYADGAGVSIHQALAEAQDLPVQARGGARALVTLLRTYRDRFHGEGLTPDGLDDFIRDAGLREEVKAGYESKRAVEKRLELLDELVDAVRAMAKTAGRVDLGAFIESVTLDPPDDREEIGEGVTLMTLHSAKGLEFPVVFLAGMEEGLLPHLGDETDPAREDEERRLCYVGMTRAKKKLILSRAKVRKRRGTARPATPSRYLAEIPVELLDGEGDEAVTEAQEQEMAKNFFSGIQELLGGGDEGGA